jgi:hypothetical protein
VLADPQFAAVTDNRPLDEALRRLAGLAVEEWLPPHRVRPRIVISEAGVTVARLLERLVGGT